MDLKFFADQFVPIQIGVIAALVQLLVDDFRLKKKRISEKRKVLRCKK